ncbi:hypothetical protein NL676_031669 [Syzygium grande]|nr:hypothetical protein NL676_031669 [Syzygium grande]
MPGEPCARGRASRRTGHGRGSLSWRQAASPDAGEASPARPGEGPPRYRGPGEVRFERTGRADSSLLITNRNRGSARGHYYV